NDALLQKIITEDLDIIDIENYNIPKYLMLDFNNIIQDNEQKNKEIIFKKTSEYIDNIFKNRIQQFLEKYYHNKYSNDDLKILIESIKERIRICRVICFIYENENILNDESKIDKYIYKIIFKNEMSEGIPIQIINDCYDEKIILNDIENLFRKYKLENSNNIQKIVFVDSNLLSRVSRLKFKSLEQKGDIIYRMIITDLILEHKIKYIDNFHEYYLSSKFQKNICEILKISDHIQSNNLHFGDEDRYDDADYFEALLYEIYRTNGYANTKNFIYKILCKIQSIKSNNDIWEISLQHYNWTNKLTKLLNFNISKLSIYFDGLDHKGVCYKLVNSFIRDYCLLKTADFKENTSMRYRMIEINEIILPSKMEHNSLMMSLYNLFHNDFDEFDKNINTIIYND
ncbi:MAG: hypothetical protein K2L64_03870, partial [Ureaplasma sp.]|nr:hypothetical protein [Ureaplasma sp.]